MLDTYQMRTDPRVHEAYEQVQKCKRLVIRALCAQPAAAVVAQHPDLAEVLKRLIDLRAADDAFCVALQGSPDTDEDD